METVSYRGVLARWKVELIAKRARRMGFRADEIPDIQQQIVVDLLAFQFDRANGAKESTALQALIDNQLKKICRSTARYRAHLERFGAERPRQTSTDRLSALADDQRESEWGVPSNTFS